MVTQHGTKFAVHIITNHFGDRVAKVCECLLRRGPLNRQNIKRYTELSDEQVKNSLLVLIQQNCVQAFITEQSGGFGDEPRLNTQYVALFDNILHRVRFAKFLTIASQEFDKQCVELLQGLLEHGRLTLKQMFDRAKSSEREGKSFNLFAFSLFFSHYHSISIIKVNVRIIFFQEHLWFWILFENLFLILQLLITLSAAQPLNHFLWQQQKKKLLQGSEVLSPLRYLHIHVKFISFGILALEQDKLSINMYICLIEEPETIEKRAVAAAAPVEALRFSVISTDSDVHGEKNDSNSTSITLGEKRKHDALESDECGAADELTVLYRANFGEFIRRLRHKVGLNCLHANIVYSLNGLLIVRLACIETVRVRLDDGAATVLGAMLEATRSAEQKVKTRNSVPLSLGSIYEEVIKSEAGRNMTLDHVKASLIQLGHPPLVKESNGSYSVEFEKIIELAQNDEMESVVLKKYGRDAYRIFRLLSKAGCLLETDKVMIINWWPLACRDFHFLFELFDFPILKRLHDSELISDITFVEKKDTPKILYKMWKDDYLHMEKLVLSGARQSQFLLWKVNKTILCQYVLDEMFHAALNLSLRLAYELDQEKELLNLPVDRRTGHLLDRYNRLKRVRILLESSQMKLDDAIMLFHYF
ncbi:hypothetical protein Pint_17453 [Pistacia integerrima]|uniref:Uncharacterized protein n=1 Tax=Pistacia integerrima TaxID=434235 RepID=A0ACC0YYM0_9ROSI|nr:hypothetical protein Pint_17453 [Pistacia integerrima]